MATVVIICLLTFSGYDLYVFNQFQAGQTNNGEPQKTESPTSGQGIDADIIGKSTFDVNAELKRMRHARMLEHVQEPLMLNTGKTQDKTYFLTNCK